MSIYDFEAINIDGKKVSLEDYKGKVVIIVNTASKCGFTPQFEGLQKLYDKYSESGLVILGFPSNQFAEQEPGSNSDVKNFCMINYGVTFPMFEKVDVRGNNSIPLFNYLTEQKPFEGFDMNNPHAKGLHDYISSNHPEFLGDNSIKWNFTKFLINKNGEVVKRFESPVSPAEIEADIEKLL